MEELGDAGWARERERMAHLQQIQQLHQLQQQVGYPGYGVPPHSQPHGPVLMASPADPLPAPTYPVPVHGGMMVPIGAPVPPPAHVPTQWPIQWDGQAQIRPGNACHQPSWEYNDPHKAAFNDKRPQGQNVYFHPRSEDGHLDLRISEWKGKHCFYQGPEDYSHPDNNRVPQEKENNYASNQEGYGKLSDDRRRRRDDSEHYDHRIQRDPEEFDYNDKYRHRDHYDRKYNERYDDKEKQYYESRKHRKQDLREYDSEYEDYYDHSYARRDNYRNRDRYNDHDRDYYDSKESYRSREKDQHKDEDRYYDERRRKDHYHDRCVEDQYKYRENNYRDRDVRRGEERNTSERRGHYDSEAEEHRGYKERDHYYKDAGDSWRDEEYKRKDYKERDSYERRALDHYDYENEDRYATREGDHRYKFRDRFRNLRSISDDSRYVEYTKKDHKTHCEEWVEQQNQKLARGEIHSFEDPGIYRHDDEQEKRYESSAGSSKRGRKPVYVGSLDRNSFYRKTAPSSLRKSQFATTRKRNKGKHKDSV